MDSRKSVLWGSVTAAGRFSSWVQRVSHVNFEKDKCVCLLAWLHMSWLSLISPWPFLLRRFSEKWAKVRFGVVLDHEGLAWTFFKRRD